MLSRFSLLFFILPLFVFFSCSQNNKNEDGPTFGSITISADETLQPLVKAETQAFEGLYQQANINVNYIPESSAFEELLNGKVKVIVATRKLNEYEEKHFHELKIFPNTVKIAYDAIAIISNKSLSNLELSQVQLNDILSGKIENLRTINKKYSSAKIKIIIDNKNSSIARYLKERAGVQDLSNNLYAVTSNEEVINYVKKDVNSLGIIGVNWISDSDDSNTNNFLNNVGVVSIASTDTAKNINEFYKPYQAYIAQKYYPFCREVYVISAEARNGLGAGLIAFIAGEKGQRIILKSGLVPATMPVRLIEIKNDL